MYSRFLMNQTLVRHQPSCSPLLGCTKHVIHYPKSTLLIHASHIWPLSPLGPQILHLLERLAISSLHIFGGPWLSTFQPSQSRLPGLHIQLHSFSLENQTFKGTRLWTRQGFVKLDQFHDIFFWCSTKLEHPIFLSWGFNLHLPYFCFHLCLLGCHIFLPPGFLVVNDAFNHEVS